MAVPSTPARRRGSVDLGLVDSLVQGSFLVQAMLATVAAEHELSITQLRLLGVLRDRDPRMSELAALLGLTRSSATGLVDRAQRRGLIRRRSGADGDERVIRVGLTDAGRALVDLVAADVGREVQALAVDLSPENRRRLSRLLSRIVIDAGGAPAELGFHAATTDPGPRS